MNKKRKFLTKDQMLVNNAQAFVDTLGEVHQLAWGLWQTKKETSPFAIPTRAQFIMQELRSHTSAMSIYDMVDGNQLRLKMSGSQIDEYFGTNGSGKLLTEFAAPAVVQSVWYFFNTIMTFPCGGYARETMTSTSGKRGEISNLTLPVTDTSGQSKIGLSFTEVKMRKFTEGVDESKMINHSELHEVKYIDVGFGLPDW